MRPPTSPLVPAEYAPRLVDRKIEILLNSSKIVEVEGVEGCGKSWSLLAHAQSVTNVNDNVILAPLIRNDPRIALAGPPPHALDEWQAVPELRELAYRSAGVRGAYILATSLEPGEPDEYVRTHPRIARRLRMRTLSLAESGRSNRSVSLAGLFEGRFDPVDAAHGLTDVAGLICAGGWPRCRELEGTSARTAAAAHVDALIARSVPLLGRKEATARRVLAAVALAAGGDTSYASLADHLGASGEKVPSRNTVTPYLEALRRLYLIEGVDGWAAPVRSASRVRTKVRYLPADPSVGAAVADFTPLELLRNAPRFLAGLRTLVLRDLLVYADALDAGARVLYYADADGVAVDHVVLLDDGRWAAINVELGDAQVAGSVKRLARLCKKVTAGGALGEPAFCAVVTASCRKARRDPESGTYIFPVTAFTA